MAFATASASLHTPEEFDRLGFTPIPLSASGTGKAPSRKDWQRKTFLPSDWRPGEGIGLRTGHQRDGTYLNVVDIDHHPEQGIDAAAYYQALLAQLPPALIQQLFTARS